jgi:polyketide biosynthesis acyl carrier protein
MTRELVQEVVSRNIRLVLADAPVDRIGPGVRLSDLGADSMDRLDVVVGALDDLGLDLSADRLAGVHDIDSLVDALYAYASGQDVAGTREAR